jgi:hypothetical protein
MKKLLLLAVLTLSLGGLAMASTVSTPAGKAKSAVHKHHHHKHHHHGGRKPA